MSFRKEYPDFAPVERHIRRAHAERAVAIADALADAILAAMGVIRRLVRSSAPADKRTAASKPLVVRASLARPATR